METERSYHHTDLKSALIREGLRILDTEGYEGLSLRKVAKACGVSQTAPYRHFRNKDELIGAITLQAMQAFNSSLQAAVDKYPADSRMQLLEMGVAYIRFFSENPEYLRLLFFSNIREKVDAAMLDDWDRTHCHEQEGHPFFTFFRTVSRYKADRHNEKMTQDELVLLCWGLVHGISALLTTGDLHDPEAVLATVENLFLRGSFLG